MPRGEGGQREKRREGERGKAREGGQREKPRRDGEREKQGEECWAISCKTSEKVMF